MPDVRHGCAAQSSARTASRPHHASSRIDICPYRSASRPKARHDARSYPAPILAWSFPPAVSASWVSTSVARPTRQPAYLSRPVLPLRAFAPRPSRGPLRLVHLTLSFGVSHTSEHAGGSQAQLHRSRGSRLGTARSAHLRNRPGAFHRPSAAPVVLNPPRSHSAVPNPGVQRTRFAALRSPLTPVVRQRP